MPDFGSCCQLNRWMAIWFDINLFCVKKEVPQFSSRDHDYCRRWMVQGPVQGVLGSCSGKDPSPSRKLNESTCGFWTVSPRNFWQSFLGGHYQWTHFFCKQPLDDSTNFLLLVLKNLASSRHSLVSTLNRACVPESQEKGHTKTKSIWKWFPVLIFLE